MLALSTKMMRGIGWGRTQDIYPKTWGIKPSLCYELRAVAVPFKIQGLASTLKELSRDEPSILHMAFLAKSQMILVSCKQYPREWNENTNVPTVCVCKMSWGCSIDFFNMVFTGKIMKLVFGRSGILWFCQFLTGDLRQGIELCLVQLFKCEGRT